MFVTVFVVVLLVIATFALVASKQPSSFRYTRSALISAPPQKVFPLVTNLHNWDSWSPWAKLDPSAMNTFEGANEGTGAIMAWEGNNKVGKGRMTVLESNPNSRISMKLEFFKPFKAVNTTEFIFEAKGQQTFLTWSMFGPSNFFNKAMGLIINCDKMVGRQFETGLAQLDAVARK